METLKLGNGAIAESGLNLIKIAVSLICLAVLFLWLFGVIFPVLNGVKHGAIVTARYKYFYSFPLIYWPYCVISCTRLLNLRTLFVSGVILHLGLMLWVLAGGTLFPLLVGLFFTALWSLVYFVRNKAEK